MIAGSKSFGRQANDLGPFLRNGEMVKIFFDEGASLTGFVDKGNIRTPAGQGLDPDGTGTSAKVQETCFIADTRCKHVE